MALFVPPTLQNVKNKGEADVFAWLATLPDDYLIYQNLEIHTGQRTEHEIDFTLIHPYAGIIVLEVKGGRRIDANGVASQYTPTGNKLTDPYVQVQAARAALWQKLLLDPTLAQCLAQAGITLHAGMAYGVCFPAKKRKTFAFTTAERAETAITLDEARHIAVFLDGLAPRRTDPIFMLAEWEALNDALWRLTARHQTLAQRFAEERVVFHRVIELATAQIDLRMAGHATTQRLAVEGRAGTGKTVLAFRTAKELAAQGQNVLFLCARVGEEDMLTGDLHFDYSPYTPDLPFTICHLEEWFQMVLQRAGIVPPTDLNLLTIRGQRLAAPLLSAALASLAAAGHVLRYDAILVDEAQDFSAPLWPVILGCLSAAAGQCAAFYDNEQSFFAQPFMPSWLGEGTPTLQLTDNLRNTRAIYAKMCELNPALEPLSQGALNPPGLPVTVESPTPGNAHSAAATQRLSRLPSGPARRSKVEEAQLAHYLAHLIHREKIRPENILIISCRNQRAGTGHSKAKASAFFRRGHIGDIPLCALRESSQDTLPSEQRSVRITTLHAVKGLDSDVVILVELDGMLGQPQKARLGYLAVSRARHALYVFGKPKEVGRYFTIVDRAALPAKA